MKVIAISFLGFSVICGLVILVMLAGKPSTMDKSRAAALGMFSSVTLVLGVGAGVMAARKQKEKPAVVSAPAAQVQDKQAEASSPSDATP